MVVLATICGVLLAIVVVILMLDYLDNIFPEPAKTGLCTLCGEPIDTIANAHNVLYCDECYMGGI